MIIPTAGKDVARRSRISSIKGVWSRLLGNFVVIADSGFLGSATNNYNYV